MIKKILLILTVAAGLIGCGGGNSTSDTPTGINPGVVSRVELLATSYVNQTNGFCYLKTKVIDGNGVVVPNKEVIFSNLSTIGVLDHTTAKTDVNGIANATLYSTAVGFATVQAEVNTGTETIRDKKTVFFTPFDIAFPGSGGTVNQAALALDVDSNNNGIFNETSDFILFEPEGKTDALIRATVTDSSGSPLLNSAVTFGSDSPEVTFPLGSSSTAPVVHTNSAGQASILARVSPSILRNFDSTVNITAKADNNTFNVLTLFLKPVTISSITIASDTASVQGGGTVTVGTTTTTVAPGTANITASVVTSVGTPPPTGTNVQFSTTLGAIDVFAATDKNGVATAKYTAPTPVFADTQTTIRASVAGRQSNTLTLRVTAPVGAPTVLTVAPNPPAAVVALQNPDGNVSDDLTFLVSGGIRPYSVVSTNPGVIASPGSLGATGTQFTVDPNAVATTTIVTLRVSDSTGVFVNVPVTVNPQALNMTLDKINVIGQQTSANGPSNLVTVTVAGGTGPYIATSNNPALTPPGIWSFPATPFTFTFFANNVGATTTVTLTVADNAGASVNRTLTIFPQTTTTGLAISINKTDVIGLPNPDGNTSDDVTFSVTGGTPPYVISAGNGVGCNNAFLSPVGPWNLAVSGNTVTLDPKNVASIPATTPQVCTLTVVDNVGLTATTTFTVHP
ncbi:MAG: hypothetical protein WA610_16455 [Thermodesulfovibrionales bacterium]